MPVSTVDSGHHLVLKSPYSYISPICPEAPPHGRIFTKICTAVEVVDIITCDKNFLAIG